MFTTRTCQCEQRESTVWEVVVMPVGWIRRSAFKSCTLASRYIDFMAGVAEDDATLPVSYRRDLPVAG